MIKKKIAISVRLKESTLEKINEIAELNEMGPSQVIREIVENYFNKNINFVNKRN